MAGAMLTAVPASARQGVTEPPTVVSFDPGSDGVIEQTAMSVEQRNDLRSDAQSALSPLAEAFDDVPVGRDGFQPPECSNFRSVERVDVVGRPEHPIRVRVETAKAV